MIANRSSKNNSKENGNYFQKKEKNLMNWVGYWRKNPQVFAAEYLGVNNLKIFQKILLYMMGKVNNFMYIAARGQGKSYLIALYCIIRCILYPETRIVLASGTKGQAKKIITEKIQSFYNNYPAIKYEIGDPKNIKTSLNITEVTFPNGSRISAETSNDNSRGLRCNILIVDEFRMVKKEVIDKVLKPMLNVNRQPAYMNKPEYEHLPSEENKEIYMSSAWYKSHWAWDSFKEFKQRMLKGESFFVVDFPYQLSVFHNLLSKERIMKERTSGTVDQATWGMEYEALFVGENDKAYYRLDPLNKIRTLNKTFIPPTDEEFIENKLRSNPKKLTNMKRLDKKNEIRLISLDIALMGGNKNVKNDTSAFTLMRLIKDGDLYRRDVVYLESIQNSISSEDLAIRLKQLYYDFEADYAIMDANGNGLGVFDDCCRVIYDKKRDVEYEPWACINDEETNKRNKTQGLKIVYTVKATADFNHRIAVQLKSAIETGKMRLPMNDIQRREDFISEGGFMKKSDIEQQRFLYSYQQASALVNELVNLEYEVRAGNIRIHEVGTTTKDRFSSLAYCDYYADELEKKLKDDYSDEEALKYLFI